MAPAGAVAKREPMNRGGSCRLRRREAADLAVAQAVVDERENFAGDGDAGFVLPALLRDAPAAGDHRGPAVVAGVPWAQTGAELFVAVSDAPSRQVVRRDFDLYAVAGEDPDAVLSHFP